MRRTRSSLPTYVLLEEIANLYAAAATANEDTVRAVTGCASWSKPTEASACSASIIEQLGRRIYRRPLKPELLLHIITEPSFRMLRTEDRSP